MDQDNDVVANLQDLNNRLTKKIRKPNVSETSEEYASLAKTLDTQSAFLYAGLVHLHRARAERLVPNVISEAGALREAGLAYASAWCENVQQIGLPDTGLETNAMLNSLVQSARVYSEFGDPLMASRRLCELGDVLFKGGQFTDAVAAYQKAVSSIPVDTVERSAYIDRLLQARAQLFLAANAQQNNAYLSVVAQPDFQVPHIPEELQLQNIELSITTFLLSLLKIAVFLRSSFPMIPVSALLNFASNRISQEVAPKSADSSDVSYAEDCDALNRFLANYPGCWRVAHGQLLRALAEAVWWRDSHAGLAVEHALLPRLSGSRTQRDICALIVTCLVSPVN